MEFSQGLTFSVFIWGLQSVEALTALIHNHLHWFVIVKTFLKLFQIAQIVLHRSFWLTSSCHLHIFIVSVWVKRLPLLILCTRSILQRISLLKKRTIPYFFRVPCKKGKEWNLNEFRGRFFYQGLTSQRVTAWHQSFGGFYSSFCYCVSFPLCVCAFLLLYLFVYSLFILCLANKEDTSLWWTGRAWTELKHLMGQLANLPGSRTTRKMYNTDNSKLFHRCAFFSSPITKVRWHCGNKSTWMKKARRAQILQCKSSQNKPRVTKLKEGAQRQNAKFHWY